MKKILVLILVCILLFGCGKKEETNEVKLCNNIDSYIEKCNKKEISYEDISSKINDLYDEYCTEDNNTCLSIKTMKSFNNSSYEFKDCSKYPAGSAKDLCETTNKSVQSRIAAQTQAQEALINSLKRNCDLVREKK